MIRFVNIHQSGFFYEKRLLVENVDDLKEYYEKFRMPQIKGAKDALRSEEGHKSRLADFATFGFKLKTGMEDNRHGGVLFLANLMGKVYKDQLRMVMMEGKKLAMNNNGGYFPIVEDAHIIDIEIKSHKIFKPVLG